MEVVNLCSSCAKCPVIEIDDDEVRIGESGNLCRLTKSEWKTLVEKVRSGELR
jgi:hypothetical protein